MFAIRRNTQVGWIFGLNGTYFRSHAGAGIKTIYVNALTFSTGISAYKKVRRLGKTRNGKKRKQQQDIPAHGKSFKIRLLQFTGKGLCNNAINQ
jgi:hypothetical protein